MKILLIHNEYGRLSGEEVVVQGLRNLLDAHGHEVRSYFRSSAELTSMTFGAALAFFSGIYNPWAIRDIQAMIAEERPDIVHIHNLYPIISPAVLPVIRQAGVPIVMTVHNYRLICPNGLFMRNGIICEKCIGGREFYCIIHNCENQLLKSAGYALRNWVARKNAYFMENISIFACLTGFQKVKLMAGGFPGNKIRVIPNTVDITTESVAASCPPGEYVGFIGRISPEKGVHLLMDSSRKLSDIPFRAAGAVDRMPEMTAMAASNFIFDGHLNKIALNEFIRNSRFIVLPTLCYEGFPTVIVEAMIMGKPVICSCIGGLPEIVEDNVTGCLVEPGNKRDLAEKIRWLWQHPDICEKMGQAGREKAIRHYSSERHYASLLKMYQDAICIQEKSILQSNRKQGFNAPKK